MCVCKNEIFASVSDCIAGDSYGLNFTEHHFELTIKIYLINKYTY